MRALATVIVGCLVTVAGAGTAFGLTWDDEGADSLWGTAANWSGDVVPSYASNDTASFEGTVTNVEYSLIDGTVSAEAGTLNLGRNGSDATLEMTGGSLKVKNLLISNTDGKGAKFDSMAIAGGTVTIGLSNLVPGLTNAVEQATVLDPENWTNVDSIVASSGTTNWSDSVSGSAEFWRLNSPANPGKGTLLISGGSVDVNNNLGNGTLSVGDGPGAIGSITMTGGSLSIQQSSTNANNNLVIGADDHAVGTVSVSNATLSIDNQLQIGQAPGASGTFTMEDGSLVDIFSTSSTPFGNASGASATVNVNGGTLTSQASLFIANGSNSTATVNVDGGTINVQNNKAIELGHEAGASGTLNVSAGTVTMRDMSVGHFTNGVGEVTVPGGQLDIRILRVGRNAATGTVNVTGGTITTSSRMEINSGSGVGILNISDGVITNGASVFIGNGGRGNLNLSGGTLVMEGNQLRIPNNPGFGEINMTGGEMLVPNTFFQLGQANGGITRTGTLDLVDGLIECKNFFMNTTAVVRCEITDGIIYDDYVEDGTTDSARVQAYTNLNILTATEPGEVIHIEFTTGYTNALGSYSNHMIWAEAP